MDLKFLLTRVLSQKDGKEILTVFLSETGYQKSVPNQNDVSDCGPQNFSFLEGVQSNLYNLSLRMYWVTS